MEGAVTAKTFERIKEIERKVPRTIVRIEKKIVKFPFRRYFLGHQKPEDSVHKPDWRTWENDRLTLTWLGQSTVLVNFFGTWILTDPAFFERVGIHVGPWTVGPRRLVHSPLRPEELPPIDIILVSHAHMDHTDMPSLEKLQGAKHLIVAANTNQVYRHLDYGGLTEVDWNEQKVLSQFDDITIEGIEVKHAGWRMPWDPCRSRNERRGMSYNAYLVEKRDQNGDLRSFVFGGDTGYIQTFRQIGERMRNEGREIDCAIMPIGTYNPWVQTHCNPEQAWRMTQEMNARRIVPVHWNTFTQSSEPRHEPMHWLRAVVDSRDSIALNDHGQTWSTT